MMRGGPAGGLSGIADFLGIPRRAASPLPHQLPYRADIDGLRAFAVLSVVFVHAFPRQRLSGGFIGVDVFFVISGFLISSLIYDAREKGKFSYADFYGRRIRRIFPALLLVLAATFAAGWMLLPPWQFSQLGKVIAGGSAFVPNFLIWGQIGYFDTAAELLPLLHLWSLGVEEQFYFVWPFLVVLFWGRNFAAMLAALGLLSFVANVGFIHAYPSEVFYFPLSRFWELLAGAALAWRERRHIQSNLGVESMLSPLARQLLSLGGALLLLACDERYNVGMAFPGWPVVLPVLGTMMIIIAGPKAWLNRAVLAHPLVVFIGLVSYPLYLWHYPLLSFLRITSPHEPRPWIKVVAILAAFVLAWATYRFVEKPIRSLRAPAQRSRAVWALLGGAAATALLGLLPILLDGLPSRYPPAVRAVVSRHFEAPASFRDGVCLLQQEQNIAAWKESCIEPPRPGPLVVLWGDSHAAHLRPGLLTLQKNTPFRLAQMTASACPPSVGTTYGWPPNCTEENTVFLKRILALKPDTVILAANWYESNFRETAPSIRALQAAHIHRIVLVGPVPYWLPDLPTVLVQWGLAHHSPPPHRVSETLREPIDESAIRAFAQKMRVTYVSPIAAFCTGGTCQTMVSDAPDDIITWDDAHFTETGSRLLVERFGAQLVVPAGSR